jgi:hypothetical protein
MERSGTGLNWRSQAPSPADVSVEAASGRLIGGPGLGGELLALFDVFSGLLCKLLIINVIYLHK